MLLDTTRLRRRLALGLLFAACAAGAAGPLPYDESADAQADVRQALAAAQRSGKPALLVFGANWCEDCRALDAALKSSRNAALMRGEFEVVKVDVGHFDRNLDVAKAWGNPIRKGIPAAVIVAPDGRVLYATRAGELADARRMSEDGIYVFFRDAARNARGKKG